MFGLNEKMVETEIGKWLNEPLPKVKCYHCGKALIYSQEYLYQDEMGEWKQSSNTFFKPVEVYLGKQYCTECIKLVTVGKIKCDSCGRYVDPLTEEFREIISKKYSNHNGQRIAQGWVRKNICELCQEKMYLDEDTHC